MVVKSFTDFVSIPVAAETVCVFQSEFIALPFAVPASAWAMRFRWVNPRTFESPSRALAGWDSHTDMSTQEQLVVDARALSQVNGVVCCPIKLHSPTCSATKIGWCDRKGRNFDQLSSVTAVVAKLNLWTKKSN